MAKDPRQIVNSKMAVVFDLDGVIADSEGLKFAAYREVFFRHFNVELDATDNSWRGKIESDVMHFFIEHNSIKTIISISDLISEKRRCYESLLGEVCAIPGVVQYISSLSTSGKQLAVATSSPRVHTLRILDRFKIKHLFQSIVTLEDVLHSKPAPDVYIQSLANLNVSANDAVVFEDTPTGAKAAQAAGIDVIPVLTSYENTDFPDCLSVIENFEEMIND